MPVSEVVKRLRSPGNHFLMACGAALTKDAERDLEDISRCIAEHDSPASADHVLERLLQTTDSLRSSPGRGASPKDLRSLGIAVVYLIADSRRDMQSLLARRLLGT